MVRYATGRVFVLLLLLAAYSTTAQEKPDWSWTDRTGQIHTRAELDDLLIKHRRWEDSSGKSGTKASLVGANLKGLDLVDAYLVGADLSGVDLSFAKLYFAKLKFGTLTGAHLNGANLEQADLSFAYMADADLRDVKMVEGSLFDAKLENARLSGANLRGVNFHGASLDSTDLANADVFEADFGSTKFEPKTLPEVRGIAAAKNLESLTYFANPDALVQLRKQFQDAGFREQERKITYALMRRQAQLSWDACTTRKSPYESITRPILSTSDSNLANCGSFVLNRVFFDLTCQYGLSPGRPLGLGVAVWLICSVLYLTCTHSHGATGLYRVYGQGLHEDSSAHRRVEEIRRAKVQAHGAKRFFEFAKCEWRLLRASMFFSMMSAFNIGFRDINFGRWLRLLTRQEFDIKAIGWARVIAGWQSLVSVFLLALWVLTYFGRPFG